MKAVVSPETYVYTHQNSRRHISDSRLHSQQRTTFKISQNTLNVALPYVFET